MPKYRLPSLGSVEIFVIAGRTLSFATAAQAVNLTPSAVSRRIQTLERELSTPLFTRFTQRLELTAAGAQFLDATGRGIYLIEEATAAVRPHRHGRVVRLSTIQSLASTWLLPQLAVPARRNVPAG